MSKRLKKKQATLQRASYTPGGSTMYVPPGQLQSTLGQTFYGSTASIPTGSQALFSPGLPLPTLPQVNPGGFPVQWRFPVAVNTFPVDRTFGDVDIPSFQQLRSLANLYSGISICERVWYDMVPRMKLNISLKPEYVAAGANEKSYRTEITYFKTWFESPDKEHDLHSWIRMALKDQTQIDELYVYKRKTRGGGLYALELVAGDQMKPLLDDWGKIPKPPLFGYQQYPWNIPGAFFRSDELFHYQESPSSNTPYGHSRVERVIVLVNQALRKQKKDLSHFTEGNIPQGMMLVPDSAIWTPDQIDAFEQAWNALLSGNQQQQVRMRFTQPGMKYQPFEQYVIDPAFDQFILNETVAAYGLSMQDLGFTGDIHKSSGDSQQNVTYRRTIDPLAIVYADFFTRVMNTDFEPLLHGEMFSATFTGYDEKEDVSAMASAYSMLTNSGILGISAASKLLNLPDDPNAPSIGRVLSTKEGPIFLDDIAAENVRQKQLQAKLASYESTIDQEQTQEQQTSAQQKQISSDIPLSSKEIEQQLAEQEDEENDKNILSLLAEDPNEPFTDLERHHSGMHDQKSHGNWAHGRETSASSDQDDLASAQKKVDAAMEAVQDAQNALAASTTTAQKLAARQELAQARADLKAAKAEQKEMLDEQKAEVAAEKAKQKQELAEQKLQAHVQKLAQAAAAKAVRMQQAAERKAQAAAVKAAREISLQNKAASRQALKVARQEQKAARTVNTLIQMISAKIVIYSALSFRHVSASWTRKEGLAAVAITQNLQQLLQIVLDHQGEEHSAGVLMNIKFELDEISKSSTSVSQAKMISTLQAKIREEDALLRVVEEKEHLRSIDYKNWRQRALDDMKQMKNQRAFVSEEIPAYIHAFLTERLSRCTSLEKIRHVFDRTQLLEYQRVLFVDIDGVLNMYYGSPIKIENMYAFPIPDIQRVMKVLDETFYCIWLTNWGEAANGWNDMAKIAHWPVAYPLSDEEARTTHYLFPEFSEKSQAIAYQKQTFLSTQQCAWIQDGYTQEEKMCAKQYAIHCIDTTQHAIKSALLSENASEILLRHIESISV